MKKEKPDLKTRQPKKIDKQFQGHTHIQEPSTATLMVLTTWHNIPTDFKSGVRFFSPQFFLSDMSCDHSKDNLADLG
jgi:hypothetical protein